MTEILIILIALKQAIKQYHWQATSYQDHILADKLEEGLEDYIDEVAELSVLITGNKEQLAANVLLAKASLFIRDKSKISLKDILEIFGTLQEKLGDYSERTKDIGLSDLCGRLTNSILRKAYLIQLQGL